MKNELIIFLDTDQEQHIRIGKTIDVHPTSPEEMAELVLLDIATLCEALVVTIRTAEEMGIKPAHVSLKDCIKHLQDGFVDPDLDCQPGKGWKKA